MINKPLNETVRWMRQKGLRKSQSRVEAACWKEDDILDGDVVKAGVIVLPTRGCSWGRASGCTMCGYVYDAGALGDEELVRTFKSALASLGDVPYLKVFNSGSFFDRNEVSKGLMTIIKESVNEAGVSLLQVESRPDFLSREALESLTSGLEAGLEVGIGLETSSDIIRENCINKGFTFDDYKTAVKLCSSTAVSVKTYLLLKPPFILEREAIADMVKSTVNAARAGTSKVSINPVNVQRGTLVERLWKSGDYRPPWLWSLVEVLKETSRKNIGIPVISHPTGGGRKRGVHNCGKCDTLLLEAIRDFSLKGDETIFEPLDCGCKQHWEDYIYLE